MMLIISIICISTYGNAKPVYNKIQQSHYLEKLHFFVSTNYNKL